MLPESRHTRTVITGIAGSRAGRKYPRTYFRDTKRPTEAHSVRGAMATQTCYKRDLDRLNDVAVVAVLSGHSTSKAVGAGAAVLPAFLPRRYFLPALDPEIPVITVRVCLDSGTIQCTHSTYITTNSTATGFII